MPSLVKPLTSRAEGTRHGVVPEGEQLKTLVITEALLEVVAVISK